MPCRECQHKIISATTGIYAALKPLRKENTIDDQTWVLVLAHLRKIEKQVASHASKPIKA